MSFDWYIFTGIALLLLSLYAVVYLFVKNDDLRRDIDVLDRTIEKMKALNSRDHAERTLMSNQRHSDLSRDDHKTSNGPRDIRQHSRKPRPRPL